MGRIDRSTQIPMPGIATQRGTRILEWLELQALEWKADLQAKSLKLCAIDAHEVHQRLVKPDMPMQPETAIHRVDHAVSTFHEFATGIVNDQLAQAIGTPARIGIMNDVW